MQRRGRQHARSATSAAEHLAVVPRRPGWRRACPRSAEPTGAPRPLEKQTFTVSKGAESSAAGTPVAASAFHRRAPARCTPQPPGARHGRDGDSTSSMEDEPAGAVVRVLQRHQVLPRAMHVGLVEHRWRAPPQRTAHRVRLARKCAPAHAAPAPDSSVERCASPPTITSLPRRVWDLERDLVAHGAVGDEHRRPPCRGSRRPAPRAGSPSDFVRHRRRPPRGAIASRMAAVGRVTVSERRSRSRMRATVASSVPIWLAGIGTGCAPALPFCGLWPTTLFPP